MFWFSYYQVLDVFDRRKRHIFVLLENRYSTGEIRKMDHFNFPNQNMRIDEKHEQF